jgi:chitin disaccharide deacetylase
MTAQSPSTPAQSAAAEPSSGSDRMIILCADDYGLTEGVSRAIGELAAAKRLSATSVVVTSPHWPASAPRLCAHRGRLSVGLHLDLTLAGPLGPMPKLAPGAMLPGLPGLLGRALLGRLDRQEIGAEIGRQLDRFEQGMHAPPDHIDGHQHVHVLPGVRNVLLETVAKRYPNRPPLIRDPSDRPADIVGRGLAAPKALFIAGLALGLAHTARSKGLPTNDTFSGVSRFDMAQPYADELKAAFTRAGRRHLVMCHPGHPDAELANLDPVVGRRRMEYDALMRDPDLPSRIWRPSRAADGPPISWTDLPN